MVPGISRLCSEANYGCTWTGEGGSWKLAGVGAALLSLAAGVGFIEAEEDQQLNESWSLIWI